LKRRDGDQVTETRKYRTPYLAFLASRLGPGKTVTDVAPEWKRLSDAERIEYVDMTYEHVADATDPLSLLTVGDLRRQNPWWSSSLEYPVSAQDVEAACRGVREGSQAWFKLTGGLVGESAAFRDYDLPQCCDEVGFGTCCSHMSKEQRTSIKSKKRMCHALSRFALEDHCGIPTHPLFLITDGDPAAPDEHLQWRLVMLLMTLHNPMNQVYLRLRVDSIMEAREGSTIMLDPTLEDFVSEIDIAMFLFNTPRPNKFFLLSYECDTLSSFTIAAVLEVTQALNVVLATNPLDAELEAIKKMTQLHRPRRHPQRPGARGQGRGRCGGRALGRGRGGGRSHEAHDSDAEKVSSDSEGAMEEAYLEGADAVEAYWAVSAEVADTPAVAPEDPGLPILEFPAPNVVIFRHPDTRVIMGRQSIIRPGQHNESISLYCRLHKCNLCVATHKCPPVQEIREWFKAGQAWPNTPAGKCEHVRALRLL
jgi:hypothetical protein